MIRVSIYAIVLATLLVLDALWLLTSKTMYNKMVSDVQCGRGIRVAMLPALLCYVVLFIGITVYALPLAWRDVRDNSENVWWASFKYGGLFGLVVYGVFNLTNLAIFTEYRWKVALIDMSWGIFVCFLSTLAGCWIMHRGKIPMRRPA